MKLVDAAKKFEALGNPTRLLVFRTLIEAGREGMSVGDLQKVSKVPGSTLNHHIAKLVLAGLVEQEKEGRTIFSKANYDKSEALLTFMMKNCCKGS